MSIHGIQNRIQSHIPVPASDRTWLGAVGILGLISMFTLTANIPGLLSGLLLATIWYFLPIPYTLAVGHLFLASLRPNHASSLSLAVTEIGFVIVLVAPYLYKTRAIRIVTTGLTTLLILIAVIFAGQNWFDAIWLTALLLISVSMIIAYGLHRYERLHLALTNTTHEPNLP